MTIKEITNAMNADPKVYITIWDIYHENLLYCGLYERITERMLDWEVYSFYVTELKHTDRGTRVTDIVYTLEYQAELR